MLNYFDVIKAQSGIPVEDIWAHLWGNTMSTEYVITTYTGTLPLSFLSKGEALKNYRLYGTENGAGVETENLFDPDTVVNGEFATVNGFVEISHYSRSDYISVVSGEKYYLANIVGSSIQISGVVYDDNKQPISNISIPSSYSASGFFTVPSNGKYIIVNYTPNYSDKNTIMVIQTKTAPTSYTPHGYKLPLTVESGAQSQDIPIYIGDTKLMDEEYVDYEEQKVNKRTPDIVIGIIKYRYVTTQGVISPYNDYNVIYAPVIQGQKYVVETAPSITTFGAGWFEETPQTNSQSYDSERHLYSSNSQITAPITGYIGIMCLRTRKQYKVHNNSTFAPTNPPVPLPEISTYSGENTLSSTETVGEVSITGYIKEIE